MRALGSILLLVVLLLPRLAAAQTAAPLGIVYSGQEAFFDLVYRNEGPAPVELKRVAPGCDCITVLSHPETVAPGASARIACVYRSTVPGNIRTVVDVFGADPAQPAFSFGVTGFVAEKAWLASAQEAMAGDPQQLLVDVRSAGEFAEAHVPRALNVPAFALKAQAALRGRKLVLLDDGLVPETLLAEVVALQARGFKDVRVLVGGLTAWKRAGGALEGPGSAALSGWIPAEKFGASRVANPWLCVEVGGPAVASDSLPRLQVGTVPELEQRLAQESWPVSGGADFRPVLVILADPALAGRIEQGPGRASGRQIYFLTGGSPALVAYEASQAALSRHTGQTFVTQSVATRPVVSGRCGSCGR